jgi:tetratricopeptide (TPR) repeat protein
MKVQGSRPLLESPPCTFLMENHDEAYQKWRAAGVQEKILVHIDAHDDLWWIPDEESINIANFICPAIKDNLVKEVYWVVPDQTWEDSRTLKPVIRRLTKVLKSYPGNSGAVKVERGQISAEVLGKPLRVLTLSNLPRFSESVLLDIDIDFLVIPKSCSRGDYDALPWCWPEDLLARLSACQLRTDLVTLAYSVEGGYTPLKWKYLGDELALRLIEPDHAAAGIRGMELIRAGALAAHRGDLLAAEKSYLEARDLLPDSPAPEYHLAHLSLALGRNDQAPALYQRALALDPSYRTAYNNTGLEYYADGRFPEAECEYHKTLSLNPEDPYAHLGLGRLAVRSKRWEEAETWLRQSLALDDQLLDAHRTLGEVLAGQGRRREAIAAFERSLRLALAGRKSLKGPIATNQEQRLQDLEHGHIHARLARLYSLEGETDKAISGYRLAIGGGDDGVMSRLCLAQLYRKKGQWQKSAQEAAQAVKMIPGDLKKVGRRLWRGWRHGFKYRRRIPWGILRQR